ncbi:MAG: hypothetical protein ACYTGU_17495, partial [Planctomycetota bacterium]
MLELLLVRGAVVAALAVGLGAVGADDDVVRPKRRADRAVPEAPPAAAVGAVQEEREVRALLVVVVLGDVVE